MGIGVARRFSPVRIPRHGNNRKVRGARLKRRAILVPFPRRIRCPPSPPCIAPACPILAGCPLTTCARYACPAACVSAHTASKSDWRTLRSSLMPSGHRPHAGTLSPRRLPTPAARPASSRGVWMRDMPNCARNRGRNRGRNRHWPNAGRSRPPRPMPWIDRRGLGGSSAVPCACATHWHRCCASWSAAVNVIGRGAFNECSFDGANFFKAVLIDAAFFRCNGRGAFFTEASLGAAMFTLPRLLAPAFRPDGVIHQRRGWVATRHRPSMPGAYASCTRNPPL